MTSSKEDQTKHLLYQLCAHLANTIRKDETVQIYHKVVEKITKTKSSGSVNEYAEPFLAEKIKKSLQLSNRPEFICKFDELHRRLQNNVFVKNRQAVLMFLWKMSESPQLAFMGGPVGSSVSVPNITVRQPRQNASGSATANFNQTSSVSPMFETARPTGCETLGITPLHSRTPASQALRSESAAPLAGSGRRFAAGAHGDHSTTKSGDHMNPKSAPNAMVPMSLVVRELIFSFQGIPGAILKLDPATHAFKLNPHVLLPRHVRTMVMRLTQVGWLHNLLRRHCQQAESSTTMGLMEKSLLGVVRAELTEYYRIVAALQARADPVIPMIDSPLSEEHSWNHGKVTLLQLNTWALDPVDRFRCLVGVTDATKNARGGAIASVIHNFLRHGDPEVRVTVTRLLAAVCKPMYEMLTRWLVDGELEDPFEEFFIAMDTSVERKRLWHDKYRVERSLLPNFIPYAEAQKILSTGKSINFLREVCHDNTPVYGRDLLQYTLEKTSVEALFMPDLEGDLRQVMDTAYRETSRRVLDVLSGPHKFMDHLHALRRYLLLGQGDFIRHLMEIINEELCKPASQLYGHNLSGILESAIRATNARFEDPDVLQRLDVRILEQSSGDVGWDVFSLDYHVTGPMNTVFHASAMSYLMLFKALWSSKRMEYTLACSWKRQTTARRLLRRLPELAPVMQRAHILTAEMIHLVQQIQYYFLFEVLECSWHQLVAELKSAESLDAIIKAHDSFLDKVKAGVLLDDESQPLLAQLHVVQSLVQHLEMLERDLHRCALHEMKARAAHEHTITLREKQGQFGTGIEEERQRSKEQEEFEKELSHLHAQLRVLARDYQGVVKQFLLDLADHPNNSLQLLSFRLDFNDHYKKGDARLAAPYTYQHRRMSEMGHRASVGSLAEVRAGPVPK